LGLWKYILVSNPLPARIPLDERRLERDAGPRPLVATFVEILLEILLQNDIELKLDKAEE